MERFVGDHAALLQRDGRLFEVRTTERMEGQRREVKGDRRRARGFARTNRKIGLDEEADRSG